MDKRISFERKKVIVFDLDGTVVDLKVDWAELKRILTEKYERTYEPPKCEFESISHCLDSVVEKNDEVILSDFLKTIEGYEGKTASLTVPIEQTVFFIKNKELFGVKRGAKLAILSLNSKSTIEDALKRATIFEKFDYIVGREDVRKWKPNPEGLFKIQEKFGVKKEEMIFIGDVDRDLETGRNAGVESHLVTELISLVKEKRKSLKNQK